MAMPLEQTLPSHELWIFFLAKIPHCVTSLFLKCSAQIKINTLKTQNYECEYHRGHFIHHAGIQNAKCPQNTMSISYRKLQCYYSPMLWKCVHWFWSNTEFAQ